MKLAQWQLNKERASLPWLRLAPDAPLVPLDDILGDRQSQSQALFRGGLRIGSAVKRLEDTFLLISRDALAVIAHPDEGGVVLLADANLDRAFFRRVFDGVPDQVDEDLGQAPVVDLQLHRLRRFISRDHAAAQEPLVVDDFVADIVEVTLPS